MVTSSGDRSAAPRERTAAIGPVRGAPMRRAVLVLLVLCVVALIAGGILASQVVHDSFGMMRLMPIAMTGFFAVLGLFFLYLFMPPLASRAGVEAERAWVASLPFALDWYFELLSLDPSPSCRVRLEIAWTTHGVDAHTLQGIIALFDTGSSVIEARPDHAELTTGPISGMTGIRINRASVYRNHRLGTAVHRLVDVVLLPLHRNAPVTRVKLSRA